jgi:hypothetical protein
MKQGQIRWLHNNADIFGQMPFLGENSPSRSQNPRPANGSYGNRMDQAPPTWMPRPIIGA